MISDSHDPYTLPPPLQSGHKIRFVSPASSPDQQSVAEAAEVRAGWGFAVEFGRYAFEKLNYLAGTDQQRIDDLNDAIRDPSGMSFSSSANNIIEPRAEFWC